MNTHRLFDPARRWRALTTLLGCLSTLVLAAYTASLVQRDFGRVEVTDVLYPNFNSIRIRAKLLRPIGITAANPGPGIVYIHGYQNNRETSDAYCIELARRGFVVLEIDAIGRGNSGIPNDPRGPRFDRTYGGKTSLEYLRQLPFVDPSRVGMMGHSLGAEMAYTVALGDPKVQALAYSGFAYTLEASACNPRNMLMIMGKWDEYRMRMTGTRDIEREWMRTPQTARVIPFENPRIGMTYGSFAAGTARRVFVPRVTHVQESHCREAVAEALVWMKDALHPGEEHWIDPNDQTWPVKEWATLLAMLAGFASLLPLGLILLRTRFFRPLQGDPSERASCGLKTYFAFAAVNGVLMWLYLPLIFVLFGLHVYVVRIDRVFPMMMVNGVVWWFALTNLIGFFFFRLWFRREAIKRGLTLADLGVSYREDRFALDGSRIGRAFLLAAGLFAFVYGIECLMEWVFIVDFRFIFPFASDLTPYRALMFLLYFPFILFGFLLLGLFLHGQIRRPRRSAWFGTFVSWSFANTGALITPLILFLLIQYVPLLTTGFIPFFGPGGVLATFVINLFHVIGVLLMVIPISTWFYQLTGKIYLGALVSAALVTWMFTSSQVIAPIPV